MAAIVKHFLAPFVVALLCAILLAIYLFSPEQNYMDRYFVEMDVFQQQSYVGYRTHGIELWEVITKLSARHREFTGVDFPERYAYLHALMGTHMKCRIRSLMSRFWNPSGNLWHEEKQMADELFDEILRELTV